MGNKYAYQRIIQSVIETPWAILPAKLVVIRDLLAFRATGGRLTDEEIRDRLGSASRENAGEWALEIHQAAAQGDGTAIAGVAVLPLVGTIVQRADMFTEMSGAMSVQRFQKSFRQALADPNVGSIVIDVDSPGGQVGGVDELSTEIFQARGQKPITAVANSLAASAGYWIATAADELVITPSGEVGSIGVFAMHEDVSQMLEQEGVKVSLIAAGKYKVEGNPFEPLDEEARAAIQARVDEYYDMFISAVARNRGVKRSDARNGFGQGRVAGAREAVSLGMADRIATIDETVNRLLARSTGSGRRRAAQAGLDFRRRRLRLNTPGSDEPGL
jgi:signal peptide peptidase SppA